MSKKSQKSVRKLQTRIEEQVVYSYSDNQKMIAIEHNVDDNIITLRAGGNAIAYLAMILSGWALSDELFDDEHWDSLAPGPFALTIVMNANMHTENTK